MHGWIIVDKPLGLGSTQVVSAVKRALRQGGYGKFKVGHGGTLDPLATGVLPVALGEATKLAGERLLTARRLVERGVRFVQVFPSPYGVWDSHQKLKENHTRLCATIDLPITGLIRDLKARGLFDETLVVFCTEFGRTPGLEQRGGGVDGRDHHPNGFTIWLAGAGVKRGHVHGATDELGYNALGDGHYVTDLHATVLHQLGLNHRMMIPGRQRLEQDYGSVIKEILV